MERFKLSQNGMEIIRVCNANSSDFEAVIKFLKTSDIDEKLLITKVIKPEEAPVAMKEWSENPASVLKILVEF